MSYSYRNRNTNFEDPKILFIKPSRSAFNISRRSCSYEGDHTKNICNYGNYLTYFTCMN